MIKLYTWGTPNGRKISIALEEMELEYECVPVNIGKDEQFEDEFLKISPNNKIPAIVDENVTIFESGAILLYLAAKSGKFMPNYGCAQYWQMMQWLMWQMAGFGPMIGQAHHFLKFNPGVAPYAEERFFKEAQRLYGVLDQHLENRETIIDDISIAEFAIFPWVSRFEFHKIDLYKYPNVLCWYQKLSQRKGFIAGYKQPSDTGPIPMPARTL